jgi:hypothetical protein
MKHALAVVCVYEVGAIWSGRYPTITAQAAQRPWIGAGLVAALTVHFVRERRHAFRR